MQVVIVESPAKAKTINKYLGPDFKVLASYGHVRDLPSKDGSVDPNNDFSMVWEIDAKSKKQLKDITSALKGATDLWLATDPDREGEAISWHVQQILAENNKLRDIKVHRVVFNEITKSAITEAFKQPRQVNDKMVEAYLARRALDYLVGFNLSPVLWRKLPGSRSAGRVQSVALRLICEREIEIENFISQEYWSVKGLFNTEKKQELLAGLTHLHGEKLTKFSLVTQKDAEDARDILEKTNFQIDAVNKKEVKRRPTAPFITSTLQQEASRKLGFSARKTMQVAQRLYEGINIGGETVGLITYMRTDSVALSQDAITQARNYIAANYTKDYLPAKPRSFKSKSKNAQEAHEAIRPTTLNRAPATIQNALDVDQFKLYQLIWKRTIACQMNDAIFDQMEVIIKATNDQAQLKATGSSIKFDGFLTLYQEGSDDKTDENGQILPAVNKGEKLDLSDVQTLQHFTQPPPRFTEASLVKTLEELGIGRPSTYASIISVLQDRNYVRLENRRFIPEDRGRIVTAFLENWFEQYVQYDFTANMEERLDEIANGKYPWKEVLARFWEQFNKTIEDTKDLRITEVIDVLNEVLGSHFIGEDRTCPKCSDGTLGLKVGKFGSFIGCSNYPDCGYVRSLTKNSDDDGEDEFAHEPEPKELGTDPETGKMVHLKKGPYGWYVQLGEKEGRKNPKRATISKTEKPDNITLERALELLILPREVGEFPDTGDMIIANIGRFGPYLNWDKSYVNLKGDDDPYTISLERAIELIRQKIRLTEGINLGDYKDQPILLKAGRYGPYVEAGSLRASLKRGTDLDSVTFEQAEALLIEAEKTGKKPATKKKTTTKKKAPAKTKKASAKKS